ELIYSVPHPPTIWNGTRKRPLGDGRVRLDPLFLSARPVIGEDVVSRLHDRVAREPTLGVVLLGRLVGCGAGPEGTGGGLILEHGPSPHAAVREPLAVLHHEVDVMQRARHCR